MPELLHECWEYEEGASSFGSVTEMSDRQRPYLMPGARLVFTLRASSFQQAMRLSYEHLDYGEYRPPEGAGDIVYSEADEAEQQDYLRIRHTYTPDVPIFQARFHRGDEEGGRCTFIALDEETALIDSGRFFRAHYEIWLGDYAQFETEIVRMRLNEDGSLVRILRA